MNTDREADSRTISDNGRSAPQAHDGYVHAVVAALARYGIRAEHVELSTTPRRSAEMNLVEDDPISTVWLSVEWIHLSWRDDTGWAVQVRWPGESTPRTAVGFGITATPPPMDLVAWVSVVLIHPEIVVREDDAPASTPDLEEVLALYATRTA